MLSRELIYMLVIAGISSVLFTVFLIGIGKWVFEMSWAEIFFPNGTKSKKIRGPIYIRYRKGQFVTGLTDTGGYRTGSEENAVVFDSVEDAKAKLPDWFFQDKKIRFFPAHPKQSAEPDPDEQLKEDALRLLKDFCRKKIDISDPVVKEKFCRMQSIAITILHKVEDNPAYEKKLNRFLSYYLPTTIRLMETYTDIEKTGADGRNLEAASANIERIADTLVRCFSAQLDMLYHDKALDVESDVRARKNAGGGSFQ